MGGVPKIGARGGLLGVFADVANVESALRARLPSYLLADARIRGKKDHGDAKGVGAREQEGGDTV